MQDVPDPPRTDAPGSPFISMGIPDAALQRILKRIEDNVAARRMLRPEEIPPPDEPHVLPAPPPPPDASRLAAAIAGLRLAMALRAPFFGPAGDDFRQTRSGWRQPLYWLLNLPLLMLGRRQASFNRQVLQVLEDLVAVLERQVQHQAAQDAFLRSVRSVLQLAFGPEESTRVGMIETTRRDLRELEATAEALRERMVALGTAVDRTARAHSSPPGAE